MNSYTPRAPYVEALFAHEEIDVLFVCETKQQRRPSGSVKPLDLSKRPGMLRRDGACQSSRNKLQILVVRHADVRIIGVYASPSASAADWAELNTELKSLRAKGGKTVVCGDLNASHPAWSPSGKTTGGSALQELLRPLQRREPRQTGSDTPAKRWPKSG